MLKYWVALAYILFVTSCTTCNDCTSFDEEPYIKLRFYAKEDSSAHIVIIDSINHTVASNYSYYQDTLNTYTLPLNMNTDSSYFELWFRDTSNLNVPIKRFLNLYYERSYTKQTDNYLRVQCTITDSWSNFTQYNLQCDESSTENCLSNEAIYQVYR